MRKIIFVFAFCILFSLGFVTSAAFEGSTTDSGFTNSNNKYQAYPTFSGVYGGSSSTYWPQMQEIQNDQCDATTADFAVMIPPGGCEPAVVRSDLLAEQNVPIFCQLQSVRLNPLIKVSSIKSITFKGKYPQEVAGVGFHPARAGVRSYDTLIGDPLVNNIGYAVIILKRTPNESSSSDWVEGNLTATMAYDAEKAFGVGAAEFYLETMDNSEWGLKYKQNSFWYGRGYLRADDISGDSARISIYNDENNVWSSITLKEGQTSDRIYFPGFYCKAGLKVKLNKIESEEDSALLNIDGDEIWVKEKGRVLNNRCTVSKLKIVAGNAGSVELSCSGQKVELSLLSNMKADISFDSGSEKSYEIGDLVVQGRTTSDGTTEPKWYLAYVGKTESKVQGVEQDFMVLVASDTEIESEKYTDVAQAVAFVDGKDKNYQEDEFEKAVASKTSFVQDKSLVVILKGPDPKFYHVGGKNTAVKFLGATDRNLQAEKDTTDGELTVEQKELIKTYYDKMDAEVKNLLDYYPQERNDQDAEGVLSRYGETALQEQINLAEELVAQGILTNEDLISLIEKFAEKYLDSQTINFQLSQLQLKRNYDTSNAYESVYINNDYHSIVLKQFKTADKTQKTTEILVDGFYKGLVVEGGRLFLSEKDETKHGDYLRVLKIEPTKVEGEIYYNYDDSKSQYTITKVTLFREKEQKVGKENKYTLFVRDIDVKEVAHVSLIPEIPRATTEANFTFKIGIEKRLIELTPEKANKSLEKLNKTIAEWEERIEKLGNVIETWKTTCLATAAVFNVKNLFEGFSGKSMARQKVMESYRAKCDAMPEYAGRRSVCYNKYSNEIGKDVNAYKEAIDYVNSEVEGKNSVEEWKKDNAGTITGIMDGKDEKELDVKDLTTWEQVRQYLLYKKIAEFKEDGKATEGLYNQTKYSRDKELLGIVKNLEDTKEFEDNKAAIVKEYGVSADDVVSIGNGRVGPRAYYTGKTGVDIKTKPTRSKDMVIDDSAPVQFVDYKGTRYLLVLATTQSLNSGVRGVKKIFDVSESSATEIRSGEGDGNRVYKELIQYQFSSGGRCINTYKNPSIKYYESGTVKGLPAIVPFDAKEGWYVRVSSASGGLLSNQKQGYQESGVAQFYYVCNVGPNQVEENRGGDDVCQSFDVNTYKDVDRFLGCEMTQVQVLSLARSAEEAIRQAARQYSSARPGGVITIDVGRGQVKATVASPLSEDAPIYECQDFMSPKDCQILFNVCDPVICPVSRCNFGGTQPVSNVIQSGIAGSLLLCSKNFIGFGGDVAVPICLTGVHAGLDSYLSILKAEYACLDEAAKTGRHVGICDEVTAIYKCEFFWRHAQPVLKMLVPWLAQGVYTGNWGVKGAGGGEYMTFQTAWDNMQKSVDYFKNEYAQTSFRAVEYGNVEQFGTEICQAFVGTSMPTSAKALDSLTAPESPYQFYAEFSEIPYSQATVPATSQYKVFYHIYAGKDQGVSYSIYLKNPPASSYYANNPRVSVKSGYAASGQFASEAVDFTAPTGYKELCVVINGQERCGFKSVTTDFGLDYLNKEYTKQQANKSEVKTEKECISGTPSVYSTGLNVQEGVAEGIQPEIALRGIVRVCATTNPGAGVDLGRWQDVGYCGDENIRCWLDGNSVKDDAQLVLDASGNLVTATENVNKLNSEINVMTEDETFSKLTKLDGKIGAGLGIMEVDNVNEITRKISESNLIEDLNDVERRAFTSVQQARAVYLKTKLWRVVVQALLGKIQEAPAVEVTAVGDGREGVEEVVVGEAGTKFSELSKNMQVMLDGQSWTVESITGKSNGRRLVSLKKFGLFLSPTRISCEGLPQEILGRRLCS